VTCLVPRLTGPRRCIIRSLDRSLLFALRQTGARPQELRELTWKDVRPDHLLLWEHKTEGSTREPRIIHLTPCMQRFFAVVRKRSKSDHVFLNGRGKPWTTNAVRLRVMRLKDKLGLSDDVCAYLIRHAFGTNAILNGVDVVTVSELMGHASTEITTGVYVHLAEQKSHLQKAVTRAVSTPPAASRDQESERRPSSQTGEAAPPARPARRTPDTRRAAPR